MRSIVLVLLAVTFALVALYWSNGVQPPVAQLPPAPGKNAADSGFCGVSFGECTSDSDCVVSGCSGEVCASEDVFTTCQYKDCYNSEKYGVACKCVDGKCAWVPR